MKAHQRIIREKLSAEELTYSLFGNWWDTIDRSLENSEVKEVNYGTAKEVILKYEWLGTMPPAVTRCFGIYFDGNIGGALVFSGHPGSNLKSHKNSIVPSNSHYLARGACVHWAHPHTASYFISSVARNFLATPNCTILAYSDPMAGECGTIYQALNWYYLGPGGSGNHGYIVDGKMFNFSNYRNEPQSLATILKYVPNAKEIIPIKRKGRWLGVYGTKKFKKEMKQKLCSLSLPYPKRDDTAPARLL